MYTTVILHYTWTCPVACGLSVSRFAVSNMSKKILIDVHLNWASAIPITWHYPLFSFFCRLLCRSYILSWKQKIQAARKKKRRLWTCPNQNFPICIRWFPFSAFLRFRLIIPDYSVLDLLIRVVVPEVLHRCAWKRGSTRQQWRCSIYTSRNWKMKVWPKWHDVFTEIFTRSLKIMFNHMCMSFVCVCILWRRGTKSWAHIENNLTHLEILYIFLFSGNSLYM